jgi:DNA-binding MarR family transcriptional regulator
MPTPRVPKKSKTVPKSFRIDEPALLAVEAEANSQNVSPNTLVNQILKQYSDFDRIAHKINSVHLSSSTFHALVDSLEKDKIIEVAKSAGSSIPQAFTLTKSGKVELRSLIDFMQTLGRYANLFEFSETLDNNGRIITLIHRYGLNWSIFLVHYMTAMFEQIGISPTIEMTDKSVSYKIPA